MLRQRAIRWGLLLLSVGIGAAAQDNPPSQGTTPAPTPAPAFGQSAPILNPDNPPLSGLDEPSLELRAVARSYISPAVQVGESADSNAGNQLGVSNSEAVSHVLGALDLQKLWPRSDLFLEYLGGAGFGNNPYYVRQLQALGFEGITRWRTGQATLRDGLNYLPDGSFFAASAGGLPGFGVATAGLGMGLPGIYHLVEGSIGTVPRLSNTATLDVVQAISPRSAFTVVGAFGNARFYHNVDNLVNGDETTVEGGYSHLVSRRDQVGAVYAFQLFRFPTNAGGEIYNHIFNLRWSHTITGKMSFVGGVGPQYTKLLYGISYTNVSVSGRAVLRYRFEHASMMASYEKFTSQGSGFFAGADTQVAQFAFRRPIGRSYEFSVQAGYSHNKRLQPLVATGVGADSYNEGSVGALLRKHLGRTWDVLAAYRFGEVEFNVPVTLAGSTGKTNRRQVGTVALEWHPKAIRLE
jgi:hypothetical protein